MRIGIDGHDLEGNRTGVGRYLIMILKAWEQAGTLSEHEVTLFFKSEVPDDIPKDIKAVLTQPLLGKDSTAIFTHWLLPKAAKEADIDVLFCPGYVAPMIWRKPFVVTLHDIIYEAHPDLFRYHSPVDALLLRRMSRYSAKRANTVLTPSHFSAGEIMAHYEISPEKIVVTPLAPDPIFSPQRDTGTEENILARLKISGPFLFSVGTIQTRRHIPECITAFVQATKALPSFQYLIAGSNQTDPYVDIEAAIAAANAKLKREALVYTPYIEGHELAHLYRAAKALVWLSEYEGFGLPPLEAQASGTPVITSKSASLPEAVGECAVFVNNPEDVDEIANAMERIMDDGTLAWKLSECGPKHAANFSWETCAQKTLLALKNAAQTT